MLEKWRDLRAVRGAGLSRCRPADSPFFLLGFHLQCLITNHSMAELQTATKEIESLKAQLATSSAPVELLRRQSIALHTEISQLHHDLDTERDDHIRTVNSLMGSIQALEGQLASSRRPSEVKAMSVSISSTASAASPILAAAKLPDKFPEPTPESTDVINRLRRESISLHAELSHLHHAAEEEREDHLRAVQGLSGTIKMLQEQLKESSGSTAPESSVEEHPAVDRLRRQSVSLVSEVSMLEHQLDEERQDHLTAVSSLTGTIKDLEGRLRDAERRASLVPSVAPESPIDEHPAVDRLRRQSVNYASQVSILQHELEEEREDHLRAVSGLSGTIKALEEKLKESQTAQSVSSVAAESPIDDHPAVDRLRRQSVNLASEVSMLQHELEEEREDHLRAVSGLSSTITELEGRLRDAERRASIIPPESPIDDHPAVDRLRRQSVSLVSEVSILQHQLDEEREDHMRAIGGLGGTIRLLEEKLHAAEARAQKAEEALKAANEEPKEPVELDRLRRQSITLHSELSHLHEEVQGEKEDHIRTVNSLTNSIQRLEARLKEEEAKGKAALQRAEKAEAKLAKLEGHGNGAVVEAPATPVLPALPPTPNAEVAPTPPPKKKGWFWR